MPLHMQTSNTTAVTYTALNYAEQAFYSSALQSLKHNAVPEIRSADLSIKNRRYLEKVLHLLKAFTFMLIVQQEDNM